MAALHARLHLPPPVSGGDDGACPPARRKAADVAVHVQRPAENWTAADFDDSSWSEGPAGFGEPTTPGSVVRTPWKTSDIWLRRTVEIPAGALTSPTSASITTRTPRSPSTAARSPRSGLRHGVHPLRVGRESPRGAEGRRQHHRRPLPADRRRAAHRRGNRECGRETAGLKTGHLAPPIGGTFPEAKAAIYTNVHLFG
jgi:hypothetical protein